jgi:formyltetrahydrofolate hydrolase
MNGEELLAARLLSMFTAYKGRQASKMVAFYEDRLHCLEDLLLETRHRVMELQVANDLPYMN